LYFGDQVNADLAEPSLRFGWRTAAIIPELAKEIQTYDSPEFIKLVHRLNAIDAVFCTDGDFVQSVFETASFILSY